MWEMYGTLQELKEEKGQTQSLYILSPLVSAFCAAGTNDHRLSHVEHPIFIISHFCWSQVDDGSAGLSAPSFTRPKPSCQSAGGSSGILWRICFQTHSGAGRFSPLQLYDGGLCFFASCWLGAILSFHGSLYSLACDFLSPSRISHLSIFPVCHVFLTVSSWPFSWSQFFAFQGHINLLIWTCPSTALIPLQSRFTTAPRIASGWMIREQQS